MRVAQVLGEDGRGGAVSVAQVDERDALVLSVGGMVVDHAAWADVRGQRVVRSPGLGVDQHDPGFRPEADLLHRHQTDVEVLHHRPVFSTADDPAEGDDRFHLGDLLENVLESRGARERVGVGVVVGKNDERLRALHHFDKRDQRSLGLAHTSRRRNGTRRRVRQHIAVGPSGCPAGPGGGGGRNESDCCGW